MLPRKKPYTLIELIVIIVVLNIRSKIYIPEIIEKDIGEVSDGYHTFNELYHHRMILFSVICNQNRENSWKSKLHADGTMYDNYFIVGITTTEGNYTYHYHMDNWDYFRVKELEYAPEWDGHKPEDITRLLSLNKLDTEIFHIEDYEVFVTRYTHDLYEVEILWKGELINGSGTAGLLGLSNYIKKEIKENEIREFGYCRLDLEEWN